MTNLNAHQKFVVITGAGSGLGLAISKKFISEGYHVIAIGRRPQPLESLRNEFPKQVSIAPADLTQSSQVDALTQTIAKIVGTSGVHALINNAGIYERSPLADSTDELWTQLFESNLMSAVRITRGLMPLLETAHGAILNVSSSLGLKPVPETGAYSAIKAAMISWTETLALECAPQKVRANCVAPGIVDTPIHGFHGDTKEKKQEDWGWLQPLGRIGQPEDVAHGVWMLCAPGSEWMTGSVLKIDGGIHLA